MCCVAVYFLHSCSRVCHLQVRRWFSPWRGPQHWCAQTDSHSSQRVSLPPDPVVVIGLSAKNYGHLPIEMMIFWHPPNVEAGVKIQWSRMDIETRLQNEGVFPVAPLSSPRSVVACDSGSEWPWSTAVSTGLGRGQVERMDALTRGRNEETEVGMGQNGQNRQNGQNQIWQWFNINVYQHISTYINIYQHISTYINLWPWKPRNLQYFMGPAPVLQGWWKSQPGISPEARSGCNQTCQKWWENDGNMIEKWWKMRSQTTFRYV